MERLKLFSKQFAKILVLIVFLAGGVLTAQMEHPKVEKNGKLKSKKTKKVDHHNKMEKKKQHHKVEWNHHSQAENNTFSKKKKKKIKVQ
jgi:hypothetical protein